MIQNRRALTYVAIALIVGAALALAVALSRSDSAATGMGEYGTQLQSAQGVTADTGDYSATDAGALAADPAKKDPMLDKFTSKDPFVPLDVANTSGTGTNTDTGSTTNSGLSAKVTVNGTSYTVTQGDKVPDSNAVFEISGISSNDVTFKLINGQFTDGSSTVTIAVGDSMKVTNQDTSTEYTLKVVSVGSATTYGVAGPLHLGAEREQPERRGRRDPRGRRPDLQRQRGGRHLLDRLGSDQDPRHQRRGPDRHRHARRCDDHAARRSGGRQVGRRTKR